MDEHVEDEFVRRARQEGWRSRAVYKLMEIMEKDRILKPGMTVVDLGAAPGAWSQYAAQVVGSRGWVIAVDLLPMDPLPGVEFIQGDFASRRRSMRWRPRWASGQPGLYFRIWPPISVGWRQWISRGPCILPSLPWTSRVPGSPRAARW
jgi:hypothetical protein